MWGWGLGAVTEKATESDSEIATNPGVSMTVTKTRSYQKGSTDSAVGLSESRAMLPLGFMAAGL